MIIFHRLKSLARWVFRRGEVERQLHDELESFIDLTARDKIRDGVAPDEARRLARLELRGVDQTKERCAGIDGARNSMCFCRIFVTAGGR